MVAIHPPQQRNRATEKAIGTAYGAAKEPAWRSGRGEGGGTGDGEEVGVGARPGERAQAEAR
jgi:hypothetical protein